MTSILITRLPTRAEAGSADLNCRLLQNWRISDAKGEPHMADRPLRSPRLIITVVLLVSGAAVSAFAQSGTGLIRVSTTGFDSGACGSDVSPCRTVQQAIDNTVASDVILVSQGTYTGTTSCLGSPVVVCVINKHVTIRGGFPTGSWSAPTPTLTPTVLDGLNANRVALVQDPTVGGASDASFSAEGVTISRGFVEGAASGNDGQITVFGAGINATNCPVFLTDVVLSQNRALGGGSAGSQPDDHGGAGAGGGIALLGTTETSILTRVRFEGNIAEGGIRNDSGAVRGGYGQGGGIFVYSSPLNGYDLEFVNNEARAGDASSALGSDSGGEEGDAQGAGICAQVGSTVTIEGMTATGNMALGGDSSSGSGSLGGGAFGAVLFAEFATLTVRDFVMTSNESLGGSGFTGGLGAGGAVMTSASTFTADRGFLIDNLAKGGSGASVAGSAGGGGLYLAGSTIQVINTIVADNVVDQGDTGSDVGGGGGGFFFQGSSGSVTHGTVASNELGSTSLTGQGAVLIFGGVGSIISFDYTIVADHDNGSAPAVYVQPSNTATFATGLFANNTTDTGGGGTITGLGTMQSALAAGFVSPGSPNFDYHILPISPALDAAVGSTTLLDIDRQDRITPDIGADEVYSLIFADGFESGSTSAWSVSQGG